MRRSFAAAMEEFRAEGRGSPDDRSVIGRCLRDHLDDLRADAAFDRYAASIRDDRLEDTPHPEGFVRSIEVRWVDGDEFLGGRAHRQASLLGCDGSAGSMIR